MSGLSGSSDRSTTSVDEAWRARSTTARDRFALVGTLYLLLVSGVGLVFVMLGQPGLPQRFNYDAQRIQLLAQPGAPRGVDSSFETVAHVYAALGLGQDPVLAGTVTYVLFLVALLVATAGRAVARTRDVALVSALALLGAVYLGQYSKDVFPAFLILLVTVRRRGLLPEVLLVAAMTGYALAFRSYWLIVVGLYVLARFWFRRGLPDWRRTAVFVVGTVVVLGVSMPLVLGVPLDSFRLSVNEGRAAGADAASLIAPYVAGDSLVAGMANMLITLASFVVPVPLLLLGTPYHAAIAVVIASFWVAVLTAVSATRRAGTGTVAQVRALALLVAFTLVQSVFEPDFGSYLRHLLPVSLSAVVLLLPPVDHSPSEAP